MPRLGTDDARRRFAAARIARLATVRADGSPHLVPVVMALEGERVYSVVDAKPKASVLLQRLRNVEGNPAVSLLVDHYDEDWDAIWWVRADGRAAVLEAGAEREHAIDLLFRKYPQGIAPRDAYGAALVVDVARWVGWTASE
ncbi:MAG TPA: TIGR03668 family PPOX class F420-dependent oxidoreductase [Candidatus Limnocylindria bacterium]